MNPNSIAELRCTQLQGLLEGNARWRCGVGRRRSPLRLTQQHAPRAVVVSCADARLNPDDIFDTDCGELFQVRNAGLVLEPTQLGQIELGIRWGAKLVFFLGHEHCGMVAAAEQYRETKQTPVAALHSAIASTADLIAEHSGVPAVCQSTVGWLKVWRDYAEQNSRDFDLSSIPTAAGLLWMSSGEVELSCGYQG